MAKKPAASTKASSEPVRSDREKIIAAFLELVAEQSFERIDFAAIAERAGVPLDRCRAEFNSPLSVLSAHMREIDRRVLAGADPDMAGEPPRERLFDVLMRRLEMMAPHKEALRSLMKSARTNPPLALAINGLAVRSQAWMLTAAGISTSGVRGAIRAQGLTGLYANVIRAWIDDDDPGLARTLAALDKALARGERWTKRLDTLCRCLPDPRRMGRWRARDRRRDEAGDEQVAV
jgi:AcrR family transcriptional regulator